MHERCFAYPNVFCFSFYFPVYAIIPVCVYVIVFLFLQHAPALCCPPCVNAPLIMCACASCCVSVCCTLSLVFSPSPSPFCQRFKCTNTHTRARAYIQTSSRHVPVEKHLSRVFVRITGASTGSDVYWEATGRRRSSGKSLHTSTRPSTLSVHLVRLCHRSFHAFPHTHNLTGNEPNKGGFASLVLSVSLH